MNRCKKIAASLLAALLLLLIAQQVWVPLHEKRLEIDNPCIVALSGGDNGYFIDRGLPSGFQLEILNAYATELGIPFRFTVANDPQERLQLLLDGEASIAVFSCSPDSLPTNDNVAYSIPIDTVLRTVWATQADNNKLMQSINMFFFHFAKTSGYRGIYWKYVDAKTKGFDQAKNKTALSPYDAVLKQCSKELGWDWRILSSLIYQESRFQHDLTSRKGASGIMQLMPGTAARFGLADDDASAEGSILAGVRYLKYIQNQLAKEADITDDEERIKFTLAAYNAGMGRLEDCRRYTAILNKNPGHWDDVASVIPLLSYSEHYRSDSLVHGRFKGGETIAFVSDIMERYYHYRNLVAE